MRSGEQSTPLSTWPPFFLDRLSDAAAVKPSARLAPEPDFVESEHAAPLTPGRASGVRAHSVGQRFRLKDNSDRRLHAAVRYATLEDIVALRRLACSGPAQADSKNPQKERPAAERHETLNDLERLVVDRPVAPPVPLNDPSYERDAAAHDLETERDGPSIGRRIFRTLSRLFIAVLLGVGATLAWQSYGEEAKEMVRTQAPSLSWLLPVSSTTSVAAATSESEQLQAMAHNLAVMRLSLEQLAAKQEQMANNQEQMANNIATVLAVERSPPPSKPSPLPARKPPQPAAQSSAVQSSSAPPAAQ